MALSAAFLGLSSAFTLGVGLSQQAKQKKALRDEQIREKRAVEESRKQAAARAKGGFYGSIHTGLGGTDRPSVGKATLLGG